MQQTETYKLNLIESSDTFSPDALNANTRRVEEVLMEKMEGPMAGLAQRITVLEEHKLAHGTYIGDNSGPRTFMLGFTPVVVYAQPQSMYGQTAICTAGEGGADYHCNIIDGGFRLTNDVNESGRSYAFFAFS